jgi:diacylglycerol kinase family enzyme
MRALLVVNPTATGTTPRGREVLISALGNDLKLDVARTAHRGHAAELARQAALDGLDVVVAMGGDGTVNEVVNGLLAHGPGPHVPDLGIVPGGSANVLARALGLPTDPVDATGALLDALRQDRRRVLGLGLADQRYFACSAGLGLDAEVIDVVERHRARGVVASPGLYVRSALRHFFVGTERRVPALTLHRPRADAVADLSLAIVANTAPWTYLGRRPVNPCPDASFDTGLDLLALRGLGVFAAVQAVRQVLSPNRRAPHGRRILHLHDLAELTLIARRPMALQLDGDHLGVRSRVTFRSAPRALRVLR